MKLGVFTVGTPEYNLEETVDLLKSIGYDGVEWRVKNPPPEAKPDNYSFAGRYWNYNKSTLDIDRIIEQAPQIKEMCEKKDLEIFSLTTYLEPKDIEQIEEVLKASVIMGCKQIRVFPPKYADDQNYNELFAKTQKELEKVVDLAKKYNVRVNLELHHGVIIPSASAAYRLISPFDAKYIGIIYDPGNMVREGFEDYRLGIELLGKYLSHVHVKNAYWKLKDVSEDRVETWEPEWAPIKKGYADLEKLVGVLKKVGYDGYLILEDFTNETDTATKLKENYDYLKELIK